MKESKPIVIATKQLDFSYRDAVVLKNVNICIHQGEFIGIIGPNGGGKTTLLKLLMGFLEPSRGTVEVFHEKPEKSCSKVAYVPQILRFDRDFPISVNELVLSGRLARLPWYGRFSKQDQEAVDQALEKVNLLDFKNASFGTLSGGQAQRAVIARAIVSEPKILYLDEPTASVDLQAEAEIYEILRGLNTEMTVLMVTHDLKAAIEIVDRVLCVQQEVISLRTEEVCEHFAFGLYHAPLVFKEHQPALYNLVPKDKSKPTP